MAATTLDRNTQKMGPIRQIVVPLAAATTIPIGVMVAVAVPSAGAVNASDTATQIVMGVSCQRASSVAPSADLEIVVDKGIFKMANNGNINATHVGQLAVVIDNQTVGLAADATNDRAAGRITEVEADGVFIDMTDGNIS